MLTVDDEVETALADLAKQEHLSLNDMVKRLIACYVSQPQKQLSEEDKLQVQLAVGREFMLEYHQTFSDLAK